MTRATQAIVVTLIGAVLLRLALFGGYLDYVRAWTRVPLLICGVVLVASSLRLALRRPRDVDHDRPKVAWLLLAPILVVFVVHPPELGAYVAERQSDAPPARTHLTLPKAEPGTAMKLGIFEFTETAAYSPDSLRNTQVDLTGFVSYDSEHHWYITRLAITCCAADAVASRVRVVGMAAPPRNTWIELTGQWVDIGDAKAATTKPEVYALQLTKIPQPSNPYE